MNRNKLDILFVNPFYYEVESFSIGVLSLATILEKNGIYSKIVDFNDVFHKGTIQVEAKQCAYHLLSYKAKIIGFSCMSNCYYFYLKVAEQIKKINCNTIVLLGGPQASMTAEETMRTFDYIDGIYIGESEETIVDNTKYFLGYGDECNVKNTLYRNNGRIVRAKEIPFIEDLDTLPRLNYNLLPNFNRYDSVLIESGRGCPFTCVFCSTKTFWKRKPRLKSVTRVISEIEYLVNQHNVHRFTMVHDLFTYDRAYVVDFCERIIKSSIDVIWSCSARIDTVDSNLIRLMYDAGCRSIFFGVEVGSEKMQQIIHKGLKLNTIKNLLKELRKYNFNDLAFSFMYNFPYETEDSIHKTVQLLLHILHDYEFDVQLGQCCLLPGTELYENFRTRLTLGTIENSMTLSLPVNIEDDIIANSPDIFTQYYIVDTPVFQKYLFLEPFMALYICLFRTFRGALTIINHYYKSDFFIFYEDFISENKNWLLNVLGDINYIMTRYEGGKDSQLEAGFKMLKYLKTWFHGRISSDEMAVMDEVIEYFGLLHQCYKGELTDLDMYEFENDVVGLNNGYDFVDCSGKAVLVKMMQQKNGNISVMRKFLKSS